MKNDLILPDPTQTGLSGIHEIYKDFFFIQRGYLNGNHFLYRADHPVLIDTGYGGDFIDTERLIQHLGVNLVDIELIVSTHCHCDHIGGNRIIQDRSGCDIAMHQTGKYFMDTKDDWATWWRYYNQKADFFQCTQPLSDGDSIAIGPHRFSVIHTPGHAADGIVLYDKTNQVLLSSDTLWENDLAVITLRVEGSTALLQVMESLDKLSALEVRMVYPGHGRPFTDIKKALFKSREKVTRYMNEKERLGEDILKKITIYSLLMKKSIKENRFLSYLMTTHWFRETIDHYFNGEYEIKYQELIDDFVGKGTIVQKKGRLFTTVLP